QIGRDGSPQTFCNDYYTSPILEENHYYPFGLKHSGYNSNNSQPNYNYKYNGKELQTELGLDLYDYGARNYDPALGRWMNIDPLAEKFNNYTPYSYTLNSPVIFVDPDGMDVKEYSWGASYTGTDAQNLIRDLQTQMSSSNNSEDSNNEEPPISFFAKPNKKITKNTENLTNDEKEDYKNGILNGVVESREYKIGDGIFSVYGHGLMNGGIADQRNGKKNQKDIYDVNTLNDLMKEMSPQYKKAMEEGKPITLYLFTCSSADGGNNSLAARFSSVFKNVTVIGAEDYVNYEKTTKGETIKYGIGSLRYNGNLITFKDGKQISSIKFSDFKKKNNPVVRATKLK
ncbi:RHS repeat-associated core domain-containing protein, partial [Flavobacterium jejuense]